VLVSDYVILAFLRRVLVIYLSFTHNNCLTFLRLLKKNSYMSCHKKPVGAPQVMEGVGEVLVTCVYAC
jgi:hypothetical protein